jgi:S1-C subfamily serine protease
MDMKKLTLGLLILTMLFFLGCAGKTINLKSSMVGIPSPYKTKVALYFESYQYGVVPAGGILFDPNLFRERARRSKNYVQDVFSQVFSEVEIVSSLREVEKTQSSLIVLVKFSGTTKLLIRGEATVLVFDKNGKELFSGYNSSSTLNWNATKKDFQDAAINVFLPIAKDLSQNSQVASYIKSEQTSHYAKQFTESSGVRSSAIPSPPIKAQTPQSGTGSGFFVSKMGHVITNAHVVKGCNRVTVGDNANKQVPAEIINTDRSNDLALLKLSSLDMASVDSKSLIQKLSIAVVPLASKGLLRSEDVRLGEKVLVAGYPFGDFFSNTIKVTTGVVSSTRGVGDDSGQFQLDAAVQPGNSGGPIYDSSGNIVGVVISQLDKLKVAKAIGSLPENVNFGIKASTVRQFLTSSGLPSKKAGQTEEKSTQQLAEIAQNQALMVMCLQ